DDRVDRDELHVVRGRVADRRAQAGGGLRVHDDGLRALVYQLLDLLVLQARRGRRQQRAEQLDVHLLRVLGLVVNVGGPEGGVVVGQVDADGDLAGGGRAGRGGAGAAGRGAARRARGAAGRAAA